MLFQSIYPYFLSPTAVESKFKSFAKFFIPCSVNPLYLRTCDQLPGAFAMTVVFTVHEIELKCEWNIFSLSDVVEKERELREAER